MNDRPNAAPDVAYARLRDRFARMATLGEASGILWWDSAVIMPERGSGARGDQIAVLAGLGHRMLVEPAVADDLAEAEAASPAGVDAINLGLMRRAHARATAVDADLVEALARARSRCEAVWRSARPANDFAVVREPLEEVLRLTRRSAEAEAAVLGLSPFDALIDNWQPGLRAADIEPVFARYEAFLARALPRAEEIQSVAPAPVMPEGPFPIAAQETLCRMLAARVGLDFSGARLDRSAHPFCGGLATDIRVTTRYDEADFQRAMLGTVHESGHAIYETGLPAEWYRQPVGESAGMAAHESQSLIIEMQACRTDGFLRFLGPLLHGAFGGDAAPYAADNLARLTRRVARTLIRVDADELTYPAHVILRFRLERALLAGDLAVADLPGAWDDGFRALLGIEVPDLARGCMQDIHWFEGLFGYFPSYTLGAMAAAQLMAAARRAVPDLDGALEEGDFAPLRDWLRANVHALGRTVDFQELLRRATGKPLDPADFEAHLTARYLTPGLAH